MVLILTSLSINESAPASTAFTATCAESEEEFKDRPKYLILMYRVVNPVSIITAGLIPEYTQFVESFGVKPDVALAYTFADVAPEGRV